MKVHGRITTFDEARGDGTFRSDKGEDFYFHCVVIANGSRTITVGARAHGVRSVGHLGRDELSDLEEVAR